MLLSRQTVPEIEIDLIDSSSCSSMSLDEEQLAKSAKHNQPENFEPVKLSEVGRVNSQ